MSERLQGVEVFVEVVRAGSFTAAADRLGVSKSAASKQITALEDRLGARLLNRTTRRLSLTEVGRAYYDRCAVVLDDILAAEQAVTELSDTPRGTLRLNAPMSFGIRYLAPAVAEFQGLYPDLRVDVTLNDRRVDVVEEGYDLAIRIADLPDSSLIARKLATCRRVTCASPEYLVHCGRPGRPEELAHHRMLSYSYISNPREFRFQENGQPLTVTTDPVVTANNGDFLTSIATAGLGILLTPSFIVGDAVRAGRLVPILQDFEADPIAIYAIYPHSRHLSAKVRLFIDHLARCFKDPPPWDQGVG